MSWNKYEEDRWYKQTESPSKESAPNRKLRPLNLSVLQ
jgi:hypothetical protein